MTLEELYSRMGGNYGQAKKIMHMDKLIDRYIRKLKDSGVEKDLAAAGETMDPKQLFQAAHAMKGVCSNLGLDELAQDAETIAKEFRNGNSRKLSDDEVKTKLAEIAVKFQKTLDCIAAYESEQ